MTIKLYEDDVYIKEEIAKVVELVEKDNNKYVVLDKTIFFPEGGGQPSDTGFIEDSLVNYVFEENGIIFHQVDKFPTESDVRCKLAWDRRFDSMQQHCGEHILSGVIFSEYGGVNKGFHLGEDYVTIDIDISSISDDMKDNIERLSNLAIYENNVVLTTVVDNLEMTKNYELRKAVTVDEKIRIVNIENTDTVACCGTHPSRTGEVGIIKILKIEKYKGMSRIFFLCGRRATEDYKLKHNMISNLAQSYSSNVDNLISKIDNEKIKYEKLKEELKKIKLKIVDEWVDSHFESEISIVEESDEFSVEDFKYACKKMSDKGFLRNLIFYSKNDFLVVACDCSDGNINWGEYFKKTIKNFKGSGGGSKAMAQGKFGNGEDLENFIESIKKIL